MTDATKARLADAAAAVFLASVTFARMWLLAGTPIADEFGYLQGGLYIAAGRARDVNFSSGVGYSYLYALAQVFVHSPAIAYLVGRGLGAALVVVATWGACRMFSSRSASFVAAGLLAATGVPYVWPGVSCVATAGIILALAVVIRWRSGPAVAGASLLMWVGASARPEFWPAAVAGTIAALVILAREGRQSARAGGQVLSALAWAAAAIALPVLLITVHHSPMDPGRLWIAFGQHYALRHLAPGEAPWSDWHKAISRDFGRANSLPQAFVIAPWRVVRHLIANVLWMPRESAALLAMARNRLPGAVLLSVLASVLLFVPAIVAAATTSTGQLRDAARRSGELFTLPFLGLWVGFGLSVLVLLVIWPRQHYLQTGVAIWTLFAAVALDDASDARWVTWVRYGAYALVIAPLAATTLFAAAGALW